jgi:photosystem II stability/assembly factor-like uncharacterized protein
MKKIILTLILTAICFHFSFSQWQQANGPYGAFITCIEANGTHVYAGTQSNGLFVSHDNGDSWTQNVDVIQTYTSITGITAFGSNVFVSGNNNIYMSSDYGVNWSQVNSALPFGNLYSFAINGTNIFAGTTPGVFLSTDSCKNWISLNNGLPQYPNINF